MPTKPLPLCRSKDQNYRRKDIYVKLNLPVCQNQEKKTNDVVYVFVAKVIEEKRQQDEKHKYLNKGIFKSLK